MLKTTTTAAAVLFAVSIPAAADASPAHNLVAPPTDKIVIDVVAVNGSGCPANTATVTEPSDNTAFTVTYSNYQAAVGVGAAPTDLRKNCQLTVRVHTPQGFTFAVAQADYRGFANLAAGASGTERANYYFQGSPQTTSVEHSFNGPFSGDWAAVDTTDVASLVFAPCGLDRDLNINTELRVDDGTSDTSTTTSFMTMDSTHGSVRTVYHFAWATCP